LSLRAEPREARQSSLLILFFASIFKRTELPLLRGNLRLTYALKTASPLSQRLHLSYHTPPTSANQLN
jgi:hypothetical protein